MTDASAGVQITPDALREVYEKIEEMDEQLDAAAGSQSAGKRAVANRLIADNQSKVDEISGKVATQLQKITDEEVLAAVYTGLVRHLNKTFDEQVSKSLEARVTSQPKQLSPEEIQGLADRRRELHKQFDILKSALELFGHGPAVADMEVKARRGSVGPRGPRVLSSYEFSVDGNKLEKHSLREVARVIGGDLKTADVRKAAGEQNVDLSEPPADFTFNVNGHAVRGVKIEGEAAGSDEDDDENETVEASA